MKILLLLALAILALTESCGGNCPSGKCPTCVCGSSKRLEDIATWCGKHSWNQACCKCIVSHESGGNANAEGYNTNGSTDVGLWQINSVSHVIGRSTGLAATQDTPPATPPRTSTAPSRSTGMPAAHGDRGAPIPPVDVDLHLNYLYIF